MASEASRLRLAGKDDRCFWISAASPTFSLHPQHRNISPIHSVLDSSWNHCWIQTNLPNANDAFVSQNIFNKILNVQQIYQVMYINLFYESTHVTLSSHTLTHISARFTRFTTSRSNSQAHLLRFYHSRGGCWCITAAAASLFSYLTSAKTYQRWISGVESSLNTSKTGHFSSICFFCGVGSPLQVSKILLATHVMITDNIHYMPFHDYTWLYIQFLKMKWTK